MKKVLFTVSLFFALNVSFVYAGDAQKAYEMYLQTVSTANNYSELFSYMSQESIASVQKTLTKYMKRGKTEEQANAYFLKISKHMESCTQNRKKVGEESLGADQVILTYSFDDVCSQDLVKKDPHKYKDMVFADIEEVYMVNEGGWKVDKKSIRPSKPKKIKKTIKLY